MATLVARVRNGRVIRTINTRSTEEKIIQLRKALGLDLRQEQKRFEQKLNFGLLKFN